MPGRTTTNSRSSDPEASARSLTLLRKESAMQSRIKFLVVKLLFLAMAVALPARGQETPLAGFDDYVNKALKDWEVPGIAIAIIKNDKVVLMKGYGVRKLGEAAPVTDKTLF